MPNTPQADVSGLVLQLAIALVIGLVFGFLSKNVAASANRRPIGYFFLGLFLGPIGFLLAREFCGLNKHASFRLTTKESMKKNQTNRDLY